MSEQPDSPKVFTVGDQKKLNEIHAALVGNESLGHKGLVKRVETLEAGQRRTMWLSLLGGGASGHAVGWIQKFLTGG